MRKSGKNNNIFGEKLGVMRKKGADLAGKGEALYKYVLCGYNIPNAMKKE